MHVRAHAKISNLLLLLCCCWMTAWSPPVPDLAAVRLPPLAGLPAPQFLERVMAEPAAVLEALQP